MNKEFRLPDVGEGLTEADIVSWHVKPGDTVTINQVIVEIETAKAVVELPSPFAGTVSALLVSEGQTVDVGIPIIAIDVPVAGEAPTADAAPAKAEAAAEAAAEPQPPAAAAPPAPPARQPVLVGYGVKPGSTSRRARKGAPTRPGSYPATPPGGARGDGGREPPMPGVGGAGAPPWKTDSAPPNGGPVPIPPPPGMSRALAKPPVRRLARDLGIDLTGLTGSGPEGSVTKEDVQKAAGGATVRSTPRSFEEPAAGSHAVAELSPAAPGAAEERIPVRGVRKHTAAAMVASAFTAPHVTEFLQVDVTETMAAVRRARELAEFAGVKVSPLLFVAKALLVAVRRHPMINSSWDEAAQEIVVKRPVNLGIAVAAERGLLVPNVKGADALALADLARALDALGTTARAGKATPEDLSGGTITITNVGVFGVDAGTPILLPGEAAILAFGQVRDLPWVVDGALAVRKVTTLSLSFDHRIVDGELGSAVLRDVGSMLADPVRMLAWS
jgi:2-oxoisovalerate dehydrogenase E2 component (dihydrolipoyl transacylase)